MSTHSHSADVKQESHTPQDHAHGHAHESHPPKVEIPRLLMIAFALVILAGAVSILGHARFAENANFESMKDAEAHVNPDLRERGDDGQVYTVKPNGLADGYAIIKIDKERENIAAIVSLCDSTDPAQGLRLFRRALESNNKSAKLVALYCADYLAHSQTSPSPQRLKGVLEVSDVEHIVALLDAKSEPDLEVRKYALHALSDLVVLTDAGAIAAVEANSKADNKYTKISDGMKSAATNALTADAPAKDDIDPAKSRESKDKRKEIKIATRKDKVNGKSVLQIRWSTPALGLAWWKENLKDGAKWDMEMQRFVVP